MKKIERQTQRMSVLKINTEYEIKIILYENGVCALNVHLTGLILPFSIYLLFSSIRDNYNKLEAIKILVK